MIKRFVDRHFRHFNAAVLRDAARGWASLLGRGGSVMLTVGGAAQLGISIGQLIRRKCVHAVCCMGATLEDDLFGLIGQSEEKAVALHELLLPAWQRAEIEGRSAMPHQFVYQLAEEGELQALAESDLSDSWVLAAANEGLPVFCFGWEDSRLGNLFAAHVMRGDLAHYQTVQTGPALMERLADWYRAASKRGAIGSFQVGDGDFPLAIAPLLRQDLQESVPLWSYFGQISEAKYSRQSDAPLCIDTPRFVIESDAAICFPILAQYVIEQMDGTD